MIDETIRSLISESDLKARALCRPISKVEELQNPNVVKTVFEQNGNALNFSLSLIPFPRKLEGHQVYEHIGIFMYY